MVTCEQPVKSIQEFFTKLGCGSEIDASGANLNSWKYLSQWKISLESVAIKNYTLFTLSKENIYNSLDWVQGNPWLNPGTILLLCH